MSDPVVIVSAVRTPQGGFLGDLSSLSAPQLGAVAVRSAVERARLKPEQVDEVMMGCVLSAGVGQAPARQAALGAGLPVAAGCTTINKVCGSGMKAVMLAHDQLLAGSSAVVVAGGMESMSNAPYLLPKARLGYTVGHGRLLDHLFVDGVEDSYSPESKGRLMGVFADDCARHFNFGRAAQEAFARTSVTRALAAIKGGDFTWELVPVSKAGKLVTQDEQPTKLQPDNYASLPPAFSENGTVTAASTATIADAAAALVLMRRSTALDLGLKPLATLVGHASHAQSPALFATAPIGALQKLLARVGWGVDDVDLWEINESFAVVTMAAMHELRLSHDRVNVNGGACALGHAIGVSGARILVTLIGALRKRGLRRGVASLCIGGGEATAMAIEVDAAVACGGRVSA